MLSWSRGPVATVEWRDMAKNTNQQLDLITLRITPDEVRDIQKALFNRSMVLRLAAQEKGKPVLDDAAERFLDLYSKIVVQSQLQDDVQDVAK